MGQKNQVPISHYYIDNGFSGRRFDRPAFQKMIQDIQSDKIECIVVKDLSRLGRDYVEMGYYIGMPFPSKGVRFVSINDQFDTTDGMTNQNKDVPVQSNIRIPLINCFTNYIMEFSPENTSFYFIYRYGIRACLKIQEAYTK